MRCGVAGTVGACNGRQCGGGGDDGGGGPDAVPAASRPEKKPAGPPPPPAVQRSVGMSLANAAAEAVTRKATAAAPSAAAAAGAIAQPGAAESKADGTVKPSDVVVAVDAKAPDATVNGSGTANGSGSGAEDAGGYGSGPSPVTRKKSALERANEAPEPAVLDPDALLEPERQKTFMALSKAPAKHRPAGAVALVTPHAQAERPLSDAEKRQYEELSEKHFLFWVEGLFHRFQGAASDTPSVKAYTAKLRTTAQAVFNEYDVNRDGSLDAVELKLATMHLVSVFRDINGTSEAEGLQLIDKQIAEQRHVLNAAAAAGHVHPDDLKEFEAECALMRHTYPQTYQRTRDIADWLQSRVDAYSDWLFKRLDLDGDGKIERSEFERFCTDADLLVEARQDDKRLPQADIMRSESARAIASGNFALGAWLSWKAEFYRTRFDRVTNDPHLYGFLKQVVAKWQAAKEQAAAAAGGAAADGKSDGKGQSEPFVLREVKVVESNYHYHFNAEVCLKKEMLSGWVHAPAKDCAHF